MLSISALSSGAGHYYLDLAQADYYLKGGEPVGQWWGQGAADLGLKGVVRNRQLEGLFKGIGPEDQRLAQNAGAKKRQSGWDLTFSAPKSVSTLWSQADERVRGEIQAAHEAAAHAALTYLQQEVGFTRRGKGGERTELGKFIVALFEHGVNRELEPQLHTHALIMNACTREDRTTGTLLSKPFYQHKMTAGALYRAELSSQLEQRIGVFCERDKRSFSLSGVPQQLNDFFSSRRKEILDELKSHGTSSAAAAALAALETRRTKVNTPPRSELFAGWKKSGEAHGFDIKRVVDYERQPLNEKQNFRVAVDNALATLTQGDSHFTKKQLLQHVAVEAQGRNLSAQFIREQVEHSIKHDKQIVHLGKVASEERFTTREAIKQEKQLIRRADAIHKSKGHGAAAIIIDDVLDRYSATRSAAIPELKHHLSQIVKAALGQKTTTVDREKLRREATTVLSAEQKEAVRYLTCQDASGLRALEGWAGTGKTSTMRAAREIWEESGHRVVGVTVGGKAAKELINGSGINTYTYAMLDRLMHPTLKDVLKHEARQVRSAIKGFGRDKLEPLKFDKNTVLVIDEAGMCSTSQLNQLFADAKKAGAMVVLVGDRDQLPAIGPGGGFAYMADRFGKAELKEIVRQHEEWMKDAVKQFAKGDAAGALMQFHLAGRLHVADDREKAVSKLVSDWAQNIRGKEKETLIFVGTRAEAHDINLRCQKERLAMGDLPAGNYVTVKAAGVIDPKSREKVSFDVYRGDRVLLTVPSRKLGVVNGDTGTVIGIKNRPGPFSDILTVKLDSGETVSIPLADYDGVRLGYGFTTHKGQGTTIGQAYLLAGGAMTSKQLSYVQGSRAAEAAFIYTDKREAGEKFEKLAKQMTTDREKKMAMDMEKLAQAEAKEREQREREEERVRQRERKR